MPMTHSYRGGAHLGLGLLSPNKGPFLLSHAHDYGIQTVG